MSKTLGSRAFVRGVGSVVLVAGLLVAGCAREFSRTSATRTEFTSYLRGATEGMPGKGPANGAVEATYDSATHVLDWQVKWARLGSTSARVEFSRPMMSAPTTDGLEGAVILGPRGAKDLLEGKVHFNVMTSRFPNGELRGRIHSDANQPMPGQTGMTAILMGSKEPQPNDSAGNGRLTGIYNPVDHRFEFQVRQAQLTGAPIVTLFESNISSESMGNNGMRGRLTLSDEEAADLLAGRWAVNVTTRAYPLGEIRGQLVPQN